jgi:hypothetical protein
VLLQRGNFAAGGVRVFAVPSGFTALHLHHCRAPIAFALCVAWHHCPLKRRDIPLPAAPVAVLALPPPLLSRSCRCRRRTKRCICWGLLPTGSGGPFSRQKSKAYSHCTQCVCAHEHINMYRNMYKIMSAVWYIKS